MTKPTRFTTSDIKRAVSVAEALGLHVAGWEIAPDGTIRVLTGEPTLAHGRVNPLDRVLQ